MKRIATPLLVVLNVALLLAIGSGVVSAERTTLPLHDCCEGTSCCVACCFFTSDCSNVDDCVE